MLRRLLDSPWLYFTLAGFLVLVALLSPLEIHIPTRSKGKPEEIAKLRERGDLNVIFILIDTLRSDRLSAYGYERKTSPVMDGLAQYGVRFAHVEAQSTWTKCSMASIWSGIFPPRTGVTRFDHAVPDAARMPAEIFQEAGFYTAGLWRNGWVAPNFGFGQGFTAYYRPAIQTRRGGLQRQRPGMSIGGSDEDLTAAGIEFLRVYGSDRRFLLYLHYMDVHQYTYDEDAAKLGFGTEHSDAYDAAIHWTDRNVGALLYELEKRDLFKKTLVVIASDHGEAFFEHGGEGHARNLYRETTDVPLIFVLPFILEKGLVVETPVRNVDVWPTILDLVGLPAMPDTDGRSLVPLMLAAGKGEPPAPAELSVAFLDRHWGQVELEPQPMVAVRRDGKRFILWQKLANRVEAFDLASDPGEQQDLAASSPPEWVGELKSTALDWLAKPPVWGAAPEVQVDELYREQLRALGYAVPPERQQQPERAPK